MILPTLFDAGVSLYAYGLGAFGEKKGRVISFDTADVEIDEEEFERTAEDLCRPVVFDRDVGQGTCTMQLSGKGLSAIFTATKRNIKNSSSKALRKSPTKLASRLFR